MEKSNPTGAASYRPGQLYKGRDGDLLFVVLPAGGGIEFVTNRGTRVLLAEAERVYGPLKLVRDLVRDVDASVDEGERLRERLTVVEGFCAKRAEYEQGGGDPC